MIFETVDLLRITLRSANDYLYYFILFRHPSRPAKNPAVSLPGANVTQYSPWIDDNSC